MPTVIKTRYSIIRFKDVPPFCPIRYQGGWWMKDGQNQIKKTDKSEHQLIKDFSLVAIGSVLVPCQVKKRIIHEITLLCQR